MDGQSPIINEELLKQLKELIPSAFTEGKLDVQRLKQALGEDTINQNAERYQLTWAGKSEAYKVLQQPTTATLRPEPEKSINFETANHIFIEGENMEVLKVLQRSYFNKVKMIYIDPPYNTGNDSFIYPDKFSESREDYLKRVNELDDNGELMREGFFHKNSKDNGRYHSNWLSMMLPRLYLARNLLRDDGVIFISIDDNELHNLKSLMNEIYGEENFIGTIIWKNSSRAGNQIAIEHEYILVYAKTVNNLKEPWKNNRAESIRLKNIVNTAKNSGASIEAAEKQLKLAIEGYLLEDKQRGMKKYSWLTNYTNIDDKWNIYYAVDLTGEGDGPARKFAGKEIAPPPGRHWMSQEYIDDLYAEERLIWRGDRAYRKLYIDETEDNLKSIIDIPTRRGSELIKKLLGKDVFDKPKPHDLIKLIARFVLRSDEIILDFFSGSGTTAQAVIELNNEDGRNRQFICVQLPENCDKISEAYKAGYITIADICRERIRRVINNSENQKNLANLANNDLGFKSFKLTPSNFKHWYSDNQDSIYNLQSQLAIFEQAEKEGAQNFNLAYELLLKKGELLTASIERILMNDAEVLKINSGNSCFLIILEDIKQDMLKDLIGLKPKEIIFLDKVFHDGDDLKVNTQLQCEKANIKFTCI